MQRVFVVSSNRTPLMPCHPARARMLLRRGKAAVLRKFPFTIILTKRPQGATQPIEVKLDPGSRTTGLALVAECKRGRKVVWASEIEHRGRQIKRALDRRRGVRRNRRYRHVRHRAARFDNRRKVKGWLAPSLMSRVHNVESWARRLCRFSPVASIAVETVRFDVQALERPGIHGAEYQQGTLLGYEVREYLLEKYARQCVYCGATGISLEVDHVVPRSKGGTNRISNLVTSCRDCNEKKGNRRIEDFLSGDQARIARLKSGLKASLRDVAAVNATRHAIGDAVKILGLPTSFWSGGRTKLNRVRQGYEKAHWIDAACVGETGERVFIPKNLAPLAIKATGHGDRQLTHVDRFGFPRSRAKDAARVRGFRTGDIVEAIVPGGKWRGAHVGRASVRKRGVFTILTEHGRIDGISYKHCRLLMRRDGYAYIQMSSRSSHSIC